MRTKLAGIVLFIILFAVGCAPRQTYQVTVRNQTPDPLTVGFVKDGEPYERHLAGIDRWAIESPLDTLPPWGMRIPPGKTADSPEITGAFYEGATLLLRVYRGEHTNLMLLTISQPSPDRLDVVLFPGVNEIAIESDDRGALKWTRIKPIPR